MDGKIKWKPGFLFWTGGVAASCISISDLDFSSFSRFFFGGTGELLFFGGTGELHFFGGKGELDFFGGAGELDLTSGAALGATVGALGTGEPGLGTGVASFLVGAGGVLVVGSTLWKKWKKIKKTFFSSVRWIIYINTFM